MDDNDKSIGLEKGEGKPDLKHRGIYLLPNLFTTAALFSGFYAVVAAMKSHFGIAAMAIFVAMLMDSLDGRVARLTNTQSAFGAEYDSLSDMVAFGVAPALVSYSWALFNFGKVGWLIAFFYAATTALRLALFNTLVGVSDKRYFRGLPCPAAAAVIAGLVWVGHNQEISGIQICWLVAVTSILVSLLMVSSVRYYSFKTLDMKGKVPFIAILGVVGIFVGIAIEPALVLFATFVIYAFSGPVATVWRIRKARRQQAK
jgi:CDP-diacylglycerol---serine O-phosphatidyltransferase